MQSVTALRRHLEFLQAEEVLKEWSLAGSGHYVEITWADSNRSLLPLKRLLQGDHRYVHN